MGQRLLKQGCVLELDADGVLECGEVHSVRLLGDLRMSRKRPRHTPGPQDSLVENAFGPGGLRTLDLADEYVVGHDIDEGVEGLFGLFWGLGADELQEG